MSGIETTQVTLRLTKDKETLSALRRNKRFSYTKPNSSVEQPVETYICSFDGKSIEFNHGAQVPLSKTIADALRRDNWVIVGEHIDGEVRPVFEVVNTFTLGAPPVEKPQYMCPECGKDMINLHNLTKHLMGDAHKKRREEPIDYETPLTEQEVATELPEEEEEQ